MSLSQITPLSEYIKPQSCNTLLIVCVVLVVCSLIAYFIKRSSGTAEHMNVIPNLPQASVINHCGGPSYVQLQNGNYVCKYTKKQCLQRGFLDVKKNATGVDDMCIGIPIAI